MLDPITQDASAFYQDHALLDDYKGVVLEETEGQRIAEALGDRKAVILRNHGLLTVGQSVDEAAWWYIRLEESCQVQLLAEAAGKPIPIDHEIALRTQQRTGTHEAGWRGFQHLWEEIISEEPDLLN